MHDESERECDALLDAALKSYAQAEGEDESVPAVTSRTMAAVRAADSQRKKATWAWWALPVAAVLVLAAVLLPLRRHAQPVSHASVSRMTQPAPPRSAQVEPPPSHAAVRRVSEHVQRKALVAPQPLPKLDVFPTPTPLSAEERALVAMAQRDPKQAEQALTMPEEKPSTPLEIKPLTIAAIEISPLNAPDKGDKEK